MFENIGIPPGTRLAHINRIDVRYLSYQSALHEVLDTYETPEGKDVTAEHAFGWQVWLSVGPKHTNNPAEWLGTYLLLLANGAVIRVTEYEDHRQLFTIKGPSK